MTRQYYHNNLRTYF